jgi:hypothetical protein
MKDYRLPENRADYFSALYAMNLTERVMPGMVYLYLPALAARNAWDVEQQLWFAFLNGMTQNPITSLRLFTQLPGVPPAGATLGKFESWFNAEWDTLQFDTDRRYQKKDTVAAVKAYATLVAEHGTQEQMLSFRPYAELWSLVRERYVSFGRLSAFSYLEYVYLLGLGADCDDLVFGDKSGSKSHRNGMMLLLGQDSWVWDKRLDNGFDGSYDFKKVTPYLDYKVDEYLAQFRAHHPQAPNTGYFTIESNLCTFKNHFFGRRYPGVYADMAQERIEWADERGQQAHTEVFKEIRSANLPRWLRSECETEKLNIKQKAALFPQTGSPYRAEHFL